MSFGQEIEDLEAFRETVLRRLPEVQVTGLPPAPIPGLGGAGGFTFQLQDRAGGSIEELDEAARQLADAAREEQELSNVYNSFNIDVPQLSIDIDRDKTNALSVPVSSVMSSLQIFLGGLLVNNFDRFGRVYKTMLHADPRYRSHPTDIRNIFVRADATMIPLSNLVTLSPSMGPDVIQRFNLYRSAEISGAPASGHSSGEAIETLERLAENLPEGMGFEWSGAAYQEIESRGTELPIVLMALTFMLLFLAAQYESWTVPLGILLVIPAGALGAYVGVWLRGFTNDIFAQIGVVTLIALVAKNAILITDFAEGRRRSKREVVESALEAAHLRFRPILMTSLTFILGMIPLVIAGGAGSASRQALGTAVLSGMISAMVLGLYLTPLYYVSVQGLVQRFKRNGDKDSAERDEHVREGA